MSDRDSALPIIAGVVGGVGVLVTLYMLFGRKKEKRMNQQLNASPKCTCKKKGNSIVIFYGSNKKYPESQKLALNVAKTNRVIFSSSVTGTKRGFKVSSDNVDSAEELERRRRLAQNKQSQAGGSITRPATFRSSNPEPYDMAKVKLGASVMLAGALALLFRSLDRQTAKKILTVIGLGWLLADGDAGNGDVCKSKPKDKKPAECCRCPCKYDTV